MATKTYFYWLAVIVWGTLIGWFSIRPSEGVGVSDVFSHFVAYFILAALLFLSLESRGYKYTAIMAVIFAFSYGTIIELIQGRLPYRAMSVLDIILNGAGALTASFILHHKDEIKKLVKRS